MHLNVTFFRFVEDEEIDWSNYEDRIGYWYDADPVY